ncbi:MAG: hypothetical protein OXG05_15595 [Gammaproteobacteria bacterium]|nr:hypothetical protein [Gammaproteobacteria bacterium]
MLAPDFDERVVALNKARQRCGSCKLDGNHFSELIASCRVPGKMICIECVNEFHDIFRSESKFDELSHGADCDFCNVLSNVAVTLIRKSDICICDACLSICQELNGPKFASRRAKKAKLPLYCILLLMEFDNQRNVQEHSDALLHRRLTSKQFMRVINGGRIPKRWREKFTDDELNNRLELLEKIVYSASY